MIGRLNEAERSRELHTGLILSLIHRGQRGKREKAKLPHDFFPALKDAGKPEDDGWQLPEEMLAQFRLMFGETKKK